MKILVIDNYDSFVYNIVHLIKEIGVEQIDVQKNDKVNLHEVEDYDKILLSPGPGVPKDAGLMPQVIERYASSKSILGICLGHQAIGEFFGGTLINLSEPLHGVSSTLKVLKPDYLFDNIQNEFTIGHYHSWVVDPSNAKDLETIAIDKNNNCMAIRHRTLDIRGLQFHPESILTQHGKKILSNWINHQ
jgi:anthranilate synthase component 2